MSLLSGPGGRLANLSARPAGTIAAFQGAPAGSGDTATAAEVFSAHISERVVHSRCIYCHVQEGPIGPHAAGVRAGDERRRITRR